MRTPQAHRRSILVLASLAAGLASACMMGPEYGGKPVTVVLTTEEQERALHETVPLEASAGPGGANAYLLTLDQWLELDGPERAAEIERHRLEGKEDARVAKVKELLGALAPYKCPTLTPARVQVYPRRHLFVASRAGQLSHAEFDPVRLEPPDRKVVVSLESVE